MQQSAMATQEIASSTLQTAERHPGADTVDHRDSAADSGNNVVSETVQEFVQTSVTASNQGQVYMNELQDSTNTIVKESRELSNEMPVSFKRNCKYERNHGDDFKYFFKYKSACIKCFD